MFFEISNTPEMHILKLFLFSMTATASIFLIREVVLRIRRYLNKGIRNDFYV